MVLTGRLLSIANGTSGLPLHKVEAYRKALASKGYELPPLDESAFRTSYHATATPRARVDNPEVDRRVSICESNRCGYFNSENRQCTHGSCASCMKTVDKKAIWEDQSCPVRMWDVQVNETKRLEMADITACIVTFGLSDATRELTESIEKFYPKLKILTQELTETEDMSIAKNKLLERCDTDLLLLLEDGFVFTENTILEYFLSILNSNPELNIVCGAELHIKKSRYLNASSGFKTINGNRVRHHNSSPWRFLDGVKYQLCDAGHNFLLVKKSKAIKWGKNGHDEWFSLMSGCSFTPDVTINNFRDA